MREMSLANARDRPLRVVDGASAPLIEGRGLTVRAGGTLLLNRVDIEVRAGELVTVIGPNGAGKTTLVRVLLGVPTPMAGEVLRRDGLRIGCTSIPRCRSPLAAFLPSPKRPNAKR